MNTPEQNNPTPTPRHDDVDTLLENLPAAYAAWEKGADSPDLERIQRRILELMREAEKPPGQ